MSSFQPSNAFLAWMVWMGCGGEVCCCGQEDVIARLSEADRIQALQGAKLYDSR